MVALDSNLLRRHKLRDIENAKSRDLFQIVHSITSITAAVAMSV